MTLQGVVNNAASVMQSIVGQKPKNQANGAEGAPPITRHQHYPKVYWYPFHFANTNWGEYNYTTNVNPIKLIRLKTITLPLLLSEMANLRAKIINFQGWLASTSQLNTFELIPIPRTHPRSFWNNNCTLSEDHPATMWPFITPGTLRVTSNWVVLVSDPDRWQYKSLSMDYVTKSRG